MNEANYFEQIRVDFHILSNQTKTKLDLYLARLVEKIYAKQVSVFILTATLAEAQEVDDLLWVYRDTSFLPHHIFLTKETSLAPILIGYDCIPNHKPSLLLNLTNSVPDYYHHFPRVIELISGTEESKKLGRHKFKYYQTQGCHLKTFQITQQ